MKKILLILIALIGFGISVSAQQLSAEKQTIIDRQRAEIQQFRDSAKEYQKKADEAGQKCQWYKNAKDPGEKVESIAIAISYFCGKQEEYQSKANELNTQANEQERLLNAAIKEAIENNKKSNQ